MSAPGTLKRKRPSAAPSTTSSSSRLSSLASVSQPPPTPLQPSLITPKYLRTHHSHLVSRLSALDAEVKLLSRAWYKSRAQHRRSAWFGAVEGVKRRARLVSESGREGRKCGRRGKSGAKEEEEEIELESTALREVVDVWCTLWDERGMGRSFLPKYDRPPSHSSPSVGVMDRASLALLLLMVHLESLRLSARRAIRILTSHLRTPPAPTFAPLVVSLVSICSAVEAAAADVVWGAVAAEGEGKGKPEVNRAEASKGIAELYQTLRAAVRSGRESPEEEQGMKAQGPKRSSRRQRSRASSSARLVLGLSRPSEGLQRYLRRAGRAWDAEFGGAAARARARARARVGEEGSWGREELKWLPGRVISSLARGGAPGEALEDDEGDEPNPAAYHGKQEIGTAGSMRVGKMAGGPLTGAAASQMQEEDLGEAIS